MKNSDRDKNFRRLCKWVADAAEIAEIACQECDRINYLMTASTHTTPDDKAFASVYNMLLFMSALYAAPQNYEGAADDQRSEYPELAFGLMEFSRIIGQLKQNDDSHKYGGWGI